jgi:hypothetical protein
MDDFRGIRFQLLILYDMCIADGQECQDTVDFRAAIFGLKSSSRKQIARKYTHLFLLKNKGSV